MNEKQLRRRSGIRLAFIAVLLAVQYVWCFRGFSGRRLSSSVETITSKQATRRYYHQRQSRLPRVFFFEEPTGREWPTTHNQDGTHSVLQTRNRTAKELTLFQANGVPHKHSSMKQSQFAPTNSGEENCRPLKYWTNAIHPTCNTLHELGIGDTESDSMFLLSDYGTWRSAWFAVDNDVGDPQAFVMKMLNFPKHDYTEKTYRMHQLDSVSMDMLTASPHVIDEFGYCGQSVLTEYALRDGLFLRGRIAKDKMPPVQRLQLAHKLIHGLADIHSIDHPRSEQPTFAHGDIKLVNVVLVNGRAKWNDFNFAIPYRWNGTDFCGSTSRGEHGVWRCPEELSQQAYGTADKCDVFMFGNVLFELLTGKEPWYFNNATNEEEIRPLKLRGELPAIPDRYESSRNDISVQILLAAMRTCFALSPGQRPTSYQLAIAFDRSVDAMNRNAAALSRDQIKEYFRF